MLARYTAHEPDPGRLHDLLRRGLRKGARATLALAALYLAAAVPLGRWLRIPYPLMALFGLSLVPASGCCRCTGRSAPGVEALGGLGLNMIWEVLAKLAIGIGLVWIGFGEYGAVAGSPSASASPSPSPISRCATSTALRRRRPRRRTSTATACRCSR